MVEQMQNQQTTADNLDFPHDLYEARMTRDSENQRILTYTDCTERTYPSLLILQLLSKPAHTDSMLRSTQDKLKRPIINNLECIQQTCITLSTLLLATTKQWIN